MPSSLKIYTENHLGLYEVITFGLLPSVTFLWFLDQWFGTVYLSHLQGSLKTGDGMNIWS